MPREKASKPGDEVVSPERGDQATKPDELQPGIHKEGQELGQVPDESGRGDPSDAGGVASQRPDVLTPDVEPLEDEEEEEE